MNTTKYTFENLLEQEHKIEIPIIQRDYAQGRKSERVTAIRNQILTNLYEAIEQDKPLDFDFVYGSLNDNVFVPLDGQQRLTTLFLLHWYLAVRDGEINNAKELLNKFTYETRVSSTDFCKSLVLESFILPNQMTPISSIIEDKPWFFLSWKKDPTIKSMLVMLDAIHEKFCNTKDFYYKLTDKTKALINFQFIKIDNFGLSDSLYIKMNARGKELTEFENFKAKFEQYLEKHHPSKIKEFSEKVDGSWTEFFWQYKEGFLIDMPFVRFFQFITEMLYYEDFVYEVEDLTDISRLKFNIIEKIYKNSQHLDFLFATLDLVSEITDMSFFFESIFSKNEYQLGKVTLFDSNVDLFNRCIKGEGFDIKEKILFYLILRSLVHSKKSTIDDDLLERIRVVRNLILRVRQRRQTEITSNLRFNDLPKLLHELMNLIDQNGNIYDVLNSGIELSAFKESLEYEREKAFFILADKSVKHTIHALEDHTILRGSIHNFDLKNTIKELSSFVSAINDIWSNDNDSLIVRSMLTIGDYSVNIGSSALGDRYFFGNGDSNRWYTVMTITGEDSNKLKAVLPKFLKKYIGANGDSPELKMQSLIDEYLDIETEKDWRYYFIKYPQMTCRNNLYAWFNDYELRNLTRNSLLGYHINPFVQTVAILINDPTVCFINSCYSQYGDKSPLLLTNKVALYSEEIGWRIQLPDDIILSDQLIKKFNLHMPVENDDYLIIETEMADRIEIAVAFVKELEKEKPLDI